MTPIKDLNDILFKDTHIITENLNFNSDWLQVTLDDLHKRATQLQNHFKSEHAIFLSKQS